MKDGMRRLSLYLVLLVVALTAAAQEVTVNVMPVQRILPPQVMLYINNPGNYFNVQLINNSQVTQNVYLAMTVEQIHPSSGLFVTVPAKRQPQMPFTLAPGQVRQLTMVELKNMFNHVVKSEVQTTPGLFDSYTDGTFGLLPEGQYEAKLTAYKWDPALANPVPVSNPINGKCQFTVCYKAQAPQFIQPMAMGTDLRNLSVAKLSRQNPQLTWREPVLACNSLAQRYTYDIKIVELTIGLQPDDAMDHNPAIYQQRGIMTPVVTIPKVALDRMKKDKTYLAQVTARTSGSSARMLNYTLIENQGKSPYRLFRVVDSEIELPKVDKEKPKEPVKEPETEPEKKDNGGAGGDGEETGGDKESEILYKFKVPTLREPTFEDGMARKTFVSEDIAVEWRRPQFVSGKGERQDTVKFSYTVDLYRSEVGVDKAEAVKGKSIFSKNFKNDDDNCTISWTELNGKNVRPGDYLVLSVTAKSTNEKSVEFVDGNNIIDFAIAEHLAKTYFQCSEKVEITNTTPTTASDAQLKDRTVGIGQYQMKIDEIKKVSGKDYYEGKGHVEWKPLGFKCMVAVKFDSLKINTDDIVYGGRAVTYQAEAEKQLSNSEVVDKLFSDWGIDNLIGDINIPYSKDIQQKATSEVKNIAEKLDVSKYYAWIKKGQSVWDQFLKGEVKDLHLPVAVPKDYNSSPVDIQIVSMKFSPTSATMDVLGEFTLPNSKYYENDILLLGAPRLCIGPDQLLPESGTVALLGDFTVNDPESSFDMTFKAPTSVLEPSNGCFVSWHDNKFEMFDVDVDMTIPGLLKVDKSGNRTQEHPILNIHASISEWDDWFAEARMDTFEPEDLQDWTFMPGDHIVYDHSKYRNADGMKLPIGFDKTKAGLEAADLDAAWQGLYIKKMGIIFPKMLSVTDKGKNWNGRLKLEGDDMYFDASGCSFQFGANNIFNFNTASIGGWGISMKELKLDVLQNAFVKSYFTGEIQTPLEGKVGYRCDMYAQGKDANGKVDPNRSAYIFKTQQIDGLKFDFWLGAMDFNKDQTYFLVEAEKEKNKETVTKVELCMGGDMTITVGRSKLKSMGKVGSFVDSKIPGISINGMRIANCERWKSHYTQNQYEAPDKGSSYSVNDFFGWKSEYNIKANKFYFSLGRWSLSTSSDAKSSAYAPRNQIGDDDWLLAQNDYGHGPSPDVNAVQAVQGSGDVASCSLGCFDFSLTDFKFDYNTSKKQAILTIGGKVALMGGQLSAGCGFDLVADANIDKLSFKFNTVKFGKAEFNSEFGGVTLKGSLEASNGDDNGYKGELEFALPGGFLAFQAKGGYFKRTTGSDKFTWGYFLATVESKAGLRLDPIVITKLKGGFYFNCKAPTTVGAIPSSSLATKGVYGAMLGVGLATSGGEKMLSADMDLTVVYDTNRNKLSQILMNGTLDALKTSSGGKGMVNAKCQLAYVNDKQKYIEINVTASGGASLDNEMKNKFKELTGKAFEAGTAVKKGLGDLTADEKEGKSTEANKNKKNETFKANCGFEVTLNFKVTMNKSNRSKWHLYIGEPPYEKRCKLTLIDFQAGKKKDAFAAWAYLGAHMYLCLGNELPNNGALPDPPQSVLNFLNGKDVNGHSQSKGSEARTAKQATINKMKNIINDAKVDGGLMVGAGAEGDFGVNAGIVYAKGAFALGFDLVLEHFGDGAKCQGGKKMGYHGWYGMGQAYAMLTGDLGVRIRLWFIKKDVSLISVGLGAMLQAGLPNPTWAYGKVRARCSLLGGIFKFNHAIEFKAGSVCMPDYGNPLDNIKMFASASPGDTLSSAGYKKEVSVYSEPRFVTNYTMGKTIRLVDENAAQDQVQNKGANESEARANCERVYKFELGKLMIYNVDKGTSKEMTYSTSNYTDYQCYAGALEAKTRYKMVLQGYAKEWNKKNSKWENPEIDGKRKEKIDKATYYFKTGELEPTIYKDIAVFTPNPRGMLSTVRWDDAVNPVISLNRHRSDLSNSSKYDIQWEVWKNEKKIYSCGNDVWTGNGDYELWRPQYNLSRIIPCGVKAGYEGSWEGDWGYGWQIKCVRIEKALQNAQMSKAQKKTNKSTKQSNSKGKSAIGSQPSSQAKSSVVDKMNDFFAKQEKNEQQNSSTVEEHTKKMTDQAARQDGRLVLFSIDFGNTVNSTFSNEASFYNEDTNSMDGSYISIHDFETANPFNYSAVPTDEGVGMIGGLNYNDYGDPKNLTSVFGNPYYAASFYANYLGLGGKTISPFTLYGYEQNRIPGFSFTFGDGGLRRAIFADGLLQTDSKSVNFITSFWRYLPLRRRDGSYFMYDNKGKEAGWIGTETLRGEQNNPNTAPSGYLNDGTKVTGIQNSHFFRYELGAAMIGDAQLIDLFSHDLYEWSWFFYRLWYQNTVKPTQDNKDMKDKNAKSYVKATLSNYYTKYMNVIKNRRTGLNNWEYSYSGDKHWGDYYHKGDYQLPLRQVMLMLWMSEDLKKIRGDKLYGDPVQNFNKNNYKHRFKHQFEAWRTMLYETFDANSLLQNWKSLTFEKYMPDAFNIRTGKLDVLFDRHKNTYKFKVNNPFKDLKIYRYKKGDYNE